MTYCCEPLNTMGWILGLCNLGRAKDSFEAGCGAPFYCEHKTISLTDYSLVLLKAPIGQNYEFKCLQFGELSVPVLNLPLATIYLSSPLAR